MLTAETRTCIRCSAVKPLEDFLRCRTSAGGRRRCCKECYARAGRERRAADPAAARAKDRAWLAANREVIAARKAEDPGLHLWQQAQSRARKNGIPFDLVPTDIEVPLRCPALGIPLAPGRGRAQPSSPTLDRVDNVRGYVAGNVQCISWRANAIKKNASLDELEKIVEWMRRFFESTPGD